MPNSDDILAANQALRGEIAGFRKDLNDVITKEKHTRWFSTGVGVVVLIIVLVWIGNRANAANEKAEDNLQYRQAACEVTNEARTEEGLLWEDQRDLIRAVLPKPPPAIQEKIDNIEKRSKKAYALRDCEATRDGDIVTITPSASPIP